MKKLRLLAAGLITAASVTAAVAAGLFQGLPIIGGASYSQGVVAVPAGPTGFTGLETFPVDTNVAAGAGASTALVTAGQLSQGLQQDVTAVATATIPNNTPWYFLDSAQGSAFTITMPATAIAGQIQHIFCTTTTVGVLTVAANTGQTIKNNPAAACTAGVGYAWVFNGPTNAWFRFQ